MTENARKMCENRKVATRFLKTFGLYSMWVKYIRRKYWRLTTWYHKDDIVDIFGQTEFTYFIRKETGVELPAKTMYLFIFYIYKVYGRKFYEERTHHIHNIDAMIARMNSDKFPYEYVEKIIKYEKPIRFE